MLEVRAQAHQAGFLQILSHARSLIHSTQCCVPRPFSDKRNRATRCLSSVSSLNKTAAFVDCGLKNGTLAAKKRLTQLWVQHLLQNFVARWKPSNKFCCVQLRIHKLILCLENTVQYSIRRGGPLYIVVASTLIGSVVVVYFGFVFPQASWCSLQFV